MFNLAGQRLQDEQIKECALAEIELLLRKMGRSLKEFPMIPFPDMQLFRRSHNDLIAEELSYDTDALKREYEEFLEKCTDEQRKVHDVILNACETDSGDMFFVYGYGGTGKTFVWRGLSAALRSKREIVLNVASSGITSLLLPGGRTAHSRFKIPININEDSMCSISQSTQLADLIIRARLIIWDEAPMTNRYCFEALDRTLRDIMRFRNEVSLATPFGGKVVVFGGDFRQILHVIPKGSRQDIISATINSSYLWKDCTVLKLTKNMRLQQNGCEDEMNELTAFSQWIAGIGDGTIGDVGDAESVIELPDDILLPYSEDPIASIVQYVYVRDGRLDNDADFLQSRAILAPTLNVVESVNQYAITLSDGESLTYLSSDNICKGSGYSEVFQELHTTEFLNTVKLSGIPNHELTLKVGTPVMLLRNIDHANGLCNGTRLVIRRLVNHVLEAKVLTGRKAGDIVLIPRITLTPSDDRLPFKFQRRQFPLIVSYAMTINKSQGQSLSCVGLLLKRRVFTHGQLYVVVSRVTERSGLKILVCDDNDVRSSSTTNVVFKEVYNNL